MSIDIAVRQLGLCGNPYKHEIRPAIATVLDLCVRRRIAVALSRELADLCGRGDLGREDAELVATSDVMVALGGDGTMLATARLIGDSGTPLLGINLGSLGYLTDIPVSGLATAIARVLDGDFVLAGRSRVHCTIWRRGETIAEVAGLNDVVVNMGAPPRALDLELRLGGTSLGRFLGDGVIFATATGSTAYSLSAGGAICQPEVPGLLVTPICPHSLGVRPLILGDDVDIEMVLHAVGDGATLTADGQVATPLARHDRLACHLTPPRVRLVKFPDSDFFEVLRHKLNWGVAPRLRDSSGRCGPGCTGDSEDS
ncbi:MAG TPA: NAD(+)/NADH kinase [Candidatus Krumholzibacteria bacterium]|nr:NAD(+)/NADH kinase [Candidatus Krumholzibacteria bacterium]HPD71523.1 NAD(+)/NADH kinase [Candidatus Krumholzibacteria bacterium]HRY41544.1 NAD(+)/NADH kinase [Candidatus Krumholzibacteria bacterium]